MTGIEPEHQRIKLIALLGQLVRVGLSRPSDLVDTGGNRTLSCRVQTGCTTLVLRAHGGDEGNRTPIHTLPACCPPVERHPHGGPTGNRTRISTLRT